MTKKSDETKAAAKDKDVMSRREKRTIPVKLDDKEISKLAKDYAGTKTKIELLEGEMKAAADKFKGDIKLLEGSAAELLGYIRTGERERELEVDVIYDWRTNEVRVVRVDNQEEITKRAMSAEERQREMFEVSHRKDKGEVKNAKGKDGKPADRKQPQPHDVIDVETREGWKRGKVQPSSGSMLDVDVGDGKIESVPVESSLWRWPDEVGENSAPVVEGDDETLKATVGEQAEAKKGKRGKKSKADDEEIPPMPGEEGLGF